MPRKWGMSVVASSVSYAPCVMPLLQDDRIQREGPVDPDILQECTVIVEVPSAEQQLAVQTSVVQPPFEEQPGGEVG